MTQFIDAYVRHSSLNELIFINIVFQGGLICTC